MSSEDDDRRLAGIREDVGQGLKLTPDAGRFLLEALVEMTGDRDNWRGNYEEAIGTASSWHAKYQELAASLTDGVDDADQWTHERLCTWTRREGRRVRRAAQEMPDLDVDEDDRPTLTIVTHSDDQLRTDWDGDGDLVRYPPDESSAEITTPGGEVLSVETEWDCGWRTTVTAPVGCTARTVDADGATIVDEDDEDDEDDGDDEDDEDDEDDS